MNADRRKQIEEIKSRLETILSDIESIKDEEQEYFDNMPESLQGGDKGQRAEEAIDQLDTAYNSTQDTIDNLEMAAE